MFSDGKVLLSLIAYNKISLVFFLFFFFLLILFILLIESHLKRWLEKTAMIFVGVTSLYQILVDLDKALRVLFWSESLENSARFYFKS